MGLYIFAKGEAILWSFAAFLYAIQSQNWLDYLLNHSEQNLKNWILLPALG